jgi:hypothetical protein
MRLTVLILFLFPFAINAQVLEYSSYSDSLDISIAERSAVDSAFYFISNELEFIDFDNCDECASRAHLIAAILENRYPSLKLAKVWLFADFKRASMEEKYKFKKNSYLVLNEACSRWGYHVAPAVIIENKGGTDTIVLDPSTQKKAVLLNNWAYKLIPDDGSALITLKEKKYYSFPENKNNKFNDNAEIWSDDNKSLYDDDFKTSLKKVLFSKQGVMEPAVINSRLKKIIDLLNKNED